MAEDRDEHEGEFDQNEANRCRKSSRAESVTVEPDPENKIYPIPRHDNALETEHSADSQSESAPFSSDASMQYEQVSEKRDERPGFLGIPIPEASPRVIRPHPAEDGTGGQQEYANLKRAIEVVVQCWRGFGSENGFTEDDVTDTERESKGGVAERDRENVRREPEIIGQNRNKRVDRAVEDDCLRIR